MLEPKWIFNELGEFVEIQWVKRSEPICLLDKLKASEDTLKEAPNKTLPKAS